MTYKKRTVRDEPPPPDNAAVLRALSGAPTLTRPELEQAARDNHDRYGFWGVSVFVAIDEDALRDLLLVRFARFPRIAVCRVGDLAERGVSLLPTGLVPHHDMVMLTVAGTPSGTEQELADLLDRILAVTHTVQENPYYDPREDRRDPH